MGVTAAREAAPASTVVRALVLVAAVIVVYAPLRDAGFVWDDDHLVYASPLVHAPDGLVRFWTTREAHDYFPLTNTTFWIEWRAWGMDARGYHATNVALHAATALLVWRILLRLGLPGAWLCALLFAVHPVAVASVAWIAERKNTLSGLLASGSVLAWLHYDEGRSGPLPNRNARRWLVAAWCLFVLALLAKTAVVGLPLVLLGCSWWRHGRLTRQHLRVIAPFFAAAAVLAAVTVLFQYENVVRPSERAIVRPEGLASRIAAAGWCVWFYVAKALWPAPLAMIHPRWDVVPGRLVHWLPLAGLAAVAALAWAWRERGGRAVLFALGSAVALLAPILGLFDIYYFRYSLVAEHWLYTALVPILALAVGAAATAARRLGRTGRVVAVACATAAVLGAGLLAFQRAATFESGLALFAHDVAVYPRSAPALYHLALELERAGRTAEARRTYARAIDADPRYSEAHHNLAALLQQAGHLRRALFHYERAAELRPDSALPVHAQGTVLESLGRRDEAIVLYRRAVELAPTTARPRLSLAFALAEQGDVPAARRELDAAIAHARGAAEVFFLAASFEARWAGRARARALARHALELDPSHEGARALLGLLEPPPAAATDPPGEGAPPDRDAEGHGRPPGVRIQGTTKHLP